ncbi:hypothetical protein BBJ28_00007052 [Nothophytophthora sp. Chile5]|nr:hypothetical protein BBJ28_00007052 [Nothophytophthora sp. Chile5]
MCLFLLPTLGSGEVSQLAGVVGESSFVQNALQSSMSSVVIPHTTRTKPLLEELAVVQPHVMSAQDLQGFIASEEGQALLTNGKTDLLVVQLSAMLSLPDVDAVIQSAASTLVEATSGKTDFALTGNDAESMELEDPVVRRLAGQVNAGEATTTIVCDAGYLIGYSAAGTAFCFSHYVNMTPEIMTGLLFGFLFLFLAYVGLSVLNAIQTPTKYPLHGPPRGKEF